MKSALRVLRSAVLTALICASAISLIATVLEWFNNPGGVFRGESGTRWEFVIETAESWFLPTFAWTLGLALVLLSLIQVVKALRKR